MDDSSSGPPKKRQREALGSDALTTDAAAVGAASDVANLANGHEGSPTAALAATPAPAPPPPAAAARASSSMDGAAPSAGEGSGRAGGLNGGGDDGGGGRIQQPCDGPVQDARMHAVSASHSEQLGLGHHSAMNEVSTKRISAPTGLGLGSGLGLPPRSGTGPGLRRSSGGLPAVGIGGFNAINGSVPPSPGAWAPSDDRAARASRDNTNNSASKANRAANRSSVGQDAAQHGAAAADSGGHGGQGSPGKPGGGSGSRKQAAVASPFATPGAAPSGIQLPGLAQQLARARSEAALERNAATGGGGGGDSVRKRSSDDAAAQQVQTSTRIASGASMSGELPPGAPSRGVGARQPADARPATSEDLQAQLGGQAAAAGITGDQLQAALELAARMPLRAITVPDSDAAANSAGGSSGKDTAANEALDSLLAALAEVTHGRGLAGQAAGRRPLLRRLQAAALAAASDALAQWEAVQAHARAAKRGWAAASSLDDLATQRRRLLKHMLRLPAEEAGEELLEALEGVRANVAAALRAAAGRDVAAAAARAAAGRLLSAGVGGVTGPQLAPGGSTEAAADRDLNRLYTLLRLLQYLELNLEAAVGATGSSGLLSEAQLPATRSARIASRRLSKALEELPQALQIAIRTAPQEPPSQPPVLRDAERQSSTPSPSPSPRPRAQPEEPLPQLPLPQLPAAAPPGRMLQASSKSADTRSSTEQQAAKVRRSGPGAWLSLEAGLAGGDAPQSLSWQHQASFAAGGGQQLPACMAPPPPPGLFQGAFFPPGLSGLTAAQLQQLQ